MGAGRSSYCGWDTALSNEEKDKIAENLDVNIDKIVCL